MRNLSSEWIEKVNSGMDVLYYKYADITLKDGTKLQLTNKDFWQDGMSFEKSVSSDNSFDIGSAIVDVLTLNINDFDGKYVDYDFEDAEVVCYIGLESTPGNIEKIRICTMTIVEQPDTETVTLSLTCEDNMRKFDKKYSESKLVYPATRKQIIQDACTVCDVQLQTLNFEQEDYIVETRPEDEALTFRQVIAWVAQIGCQWAECDEYGRLCLKWYDTESEDRQVVKTCYSFSPKHTDVVITGVRITEFAEPSEKDFGVYLEGTEGYVLEISNNKLIRKGDGKKVANMIANKCVGMIFRPFTATCPTNVALEAGDAVVIRDRKGNEYRSFITNIVLQPGKNQTFSCGAKSAVRNSSQQFSANTQIYVDARKMVQKERTEREKAIEEFSKRLENASGVYTTISPQEDGSKIFYLHNKPQLADSMMVWKMTAEAWSVSTDGGKSWNGGMSVDGDTIVRILTATGINAEWINTGALTVKDNDGNIAFQVDMDNGKVIISGNSVKIGSKSVTTVIDENLQASKEYSDGKLADYANVVSQSIVGLQNQIDGQVETFFYDYEPSLQNIPASEWTTTSEREKHEGDLFFWQSTGYAYRFTKDGATWKWQVVQDTDITKALAAAEKAQNTANNKRRVFVVQPTPPYDIGDLWTQDGGDILTCQVARSSGSSYISSDWKKMNKYTDDTIAKKALVTADVEYYLSNSSTELSGGTWVSTAPKWVDGKYMWSRTVKLDGNGNKTYSPSEQGTCIAGATGATGVTGNGIDSIKEEYYLSTSKTTMTGGNWSDIRPTDTTGKYIWTRSVITYTNGSTETTKGICVTGDKGEKGEDGNGIVSTTVTYQISNSQTTAPTGTWSNAPLDTTSEKPYLWTKTVWKYTDGKEVASYSVGSTLDGLTIGGRNLLKGSKLTEGDKINKNWSYEKNNNIIGDFQWTDEGVFFETSSDGVSNSNGIAFAVDRNVSGLKVGDAVTFSADVKGYIGTGDPSVRYWSTTKTNSDRWARNLKGDSLTGIQSDAYMRVKITVTLEELYPGRTSDQFCIAGGFNAAIYVKNIKLEKGDKATDWTPAPEDVEEKIDDTSNELHKYVTEQSTSITNDCEKIILDALTNYVETGDLESYKSTVEAQLSLLSNQMELKFTESRQQIESVNDELQNRLNTITKYFTFDINGMTIGQVESPNKVVVDNDEISILVGDNVVQKFDALGRALIPEVTISRKMTLFGYAFTQDENGNMNVDYVGGEQ